MDKKRIAIAAGAVVLVVGVVAGRERPSLDLVEARPGAAAAADDGIDLAKLQRGEATLPENDPFKRFEPPQKTAVAAPVEKPSAPALPFQYFGRLTEQGKTEVYVMRGDELISVAPGKTIGDYRVDQVAASSISFTYLPLKTKQTLDLQ
jgi:hypothetical protein